MKKYDVVALGELLIDFTQNGISEQGNPLFEANPGGAPCNVLAMVSKLGHKTAFVGKVGKDSFGKQLKDTLEEVGIDATNLTMDEEVHTTLALVHTFADGDRDFAFYRNPGADMMLTEKEIPEELIQNSKIFHFGTLSMTHEGVRAATKKALDIAKKEGCVISFDPNLRPPLWDSLDSAKEQVLYGLQFCDILKISDDEITFVTGKDTIEEAITAFCALYQPKLMSVTCGKNGSTVIYNGQKVPCGAHIRPDTIETTGAGDTFMACMLNFVLEHGVEDLSESDLLEMQKFAGTAASLITTRRGALKVMPTKEEVLSELNM